MKSVVLALHEYHDTHGSFPPVTVKNDTGRPIHSWRLLIRDQLYEDHKNPLNGYDFSFSWDAEENRQADRSGYNSQPYRFFAVVGEGTAWPADRTTKFNDFSDGTSQTVLFLGLATPGTQWQEPVDLSLSDEGMVCLRGQPIDLSTELFFAMADGAVRFLPNGVDPVTLSSLLTIDSDDPIPEW